MNSKLKAILSLLILSLFLSLSALFAEVHEITYPDSWGVHGFSIENQSTQTVSINFSITDFIMRDVAIEEEIMQQIEVPGIFLPTIAGAPGLPGTSRYIAVPQGADVDYSITASRVERMEEIEIFPAFQIPMENDEGPLQIQKNEDIYEVDEYFPAEIIAFGELVQIRGVDAVLLSITPYQYNPVSKDLLIYRDLKVEITFGGGTGQFGDIAQRNRWWDPILNDVFLNQASLPQIDYNQTAPSETNTDEYIIIVPDDPDFINAAERIEEWRTEQGIVTSVKTTTEIPPVGQQSNALEIRAWLGSLNPKPIAVLLLGDYGTQGNTIDSPPLSFTNPISANQDDVVAISDNGYGHFNNSGAFLPEIAVSRITARNSQELDLIIDRILDYEQSPPIEPVISEAYYLPALVMGYQADRWYQITTEILNGFFSNELNVWPERIYESPSISPNTPWTTHPQANAHGIISHFGPNGLGYIAGNTTTPFPGNGNKDFINSKIRSGSFFTLHRDHADEYGWDHPAYKINNLALDPQGGPYYPTFIFSINCSAGQFQMNGECFAEKFHRHS